MTQRVVRSCKQMKKYLANSGGSIKLHLNPAHWTWGITWRVQQPCEFYPDRFQSVSIRVLALEVFLFLDDGDW